LFIGVIRLHQCIRSLLGWFCILNMHNHGIGQTHRKPIQDFPSFLMPNFIGLNLLLCRVFWGKKFFLITSYELPITFSHQEIRNIKFPHLELFLFNFSIAIWERPSTISQGNTQCLLEVSQMICLKEWFYFLPWVFKVRIKVRVEQDGPCICMYVLSIRRNFILHIGLTYMCLFNIIFCMVLSTWLHTKLLYEGLDNVFALHNLQTPSFKFSQIIFAPFQNLFWCPLNVNCYHRQLCKATPLTHDLGSICKFGEIWKFMSNTISQNFSSFNFMKWEILLLPWNHLKLRLEHKMTYNSLSTTPNSLRFWETHQIYVFYIGSKFQFYWWSLHKVIIFKKTNFKIEAETLDTWIFLNTYANDMKFLSHI
jgi:hypothetical protein